MCGGSAVDTLEHRLYFCQAPCVVAQRARFAKEPFLEEARAKYMFSLALYLRGLFPHPASFWPPPCDKGSLTQHGPGAAESGKLVGEIYVGGSCSQHILADCRRAAWAVTAMGPEGEHFTMTGPVWAPIPQTP